MSKDFNKEILMGNQDTFLANSSFSPLSFSSLFYAVLPLGFQLSYGKIINDRFLEIFDFEPLPYLLSLLSSQELVFLYCSCSG